MKDFLKRFLMNFAGIAIAAIIGGLFVACFWIIAEYSLILGLIFIIALVAGIATAMEKLR